MDYEIVELTPVYLEGAIAVNELTFKGTDLPRRGLMASLDPEVARNFTDMKHVTSRKFWVAVSDGKVLGTIGYYTQGSDEAEADWVNWYCVHPEARGHGLGRKLLEFITDKSRARGKPWLRLWTSDGPTERDAQFLYDKMGFAIYKTEPSRNPSYNNVIYRQKKL